MSSNKWRRHSVFDCDVQLTPNQHECRLNIQFGDPVEHEAAFSRQLRVLVEDGADQPKVTMAPTLPKMFVMDSSYDADPRVVARVQRRFARKAKSSHF